MSEAGNCFELIVRVCVLIVNNCIPSWRSAHVIGLLWTSFVIVTQSQKFNFNRQLHFNWSAPKLEDMAAVLALSILFLCYQLHFGACAGRQYEPQWKIPDRPYRFGSVAKGRFDHVIPLQQTSFSGVLHHILGGSGPKAANTSIFNGKVSAARVLIKLHFAPALLASWPSPTPFVSNPNMSFFFFSSSASPLGQEAAYMPILKPCVGRETSDSR